MGEGGGGVTLAYWHTCMAISSCLSSLSIGLQRHLSAGIGAAQISITYIGNVHGRRKGGGGGGSF